MSKLKYRFMFYWTEELRPFCKYCITPLKRLLTEDGKEYFRCPGDGGTYFLRDDDGNELTLAEAQERMANEKDSL